MDIIHVCFVFFGWILLLKGAEAQVVTLSPTSPTVTQYSPLTLTCETQSSNVVYVVWSRRVGSNSDLAIGSISIRGDDDCSPPFFDFAPNSTLYSYACPATNRLTLTIKNVSRTENGVRWKCQPTVDGKPEPSQEVAVTVQVGITDVMLSPATDSINVIENIPTTLQCRTSGGLPAASVRWFIQRSGQVQDVTSLSTNTYQEEDNLNVTLSTLNYTTVRADQDVQIYCSANNVEVERNSAKPSINVLYRPDRPLCKTNNFNITSVLKVIIGTTFTISCTVDSNPAPYSYQWSPSGGSSQQLGFTNIQMVQGREYTLKVWNRMNASGSSSPVNGSNTTSFTVDVLFPPTEPTIRMGGKEVIGTVKVIEGNSKAFNCSTESNPVSSYSWTYPRGASSSNILQVINFQSGTYDGDYTCQVQNRMEPSFGNPKENVSMARISVDVLYPPRPPSIKYGTTTGPVITDNHIAIVRGDGESVACEADANPAPNTYAWSGSQTKSQVLSLSSFNVNTTVHCTAYNTMTETNGIRIDRNNSSTLQIIVWRPPQGVTLRYHYGVTGSLNTTEELKVLAGETFWLSCTAYSSPPSTYTWSGHPSSRAGILNITGGLTANQSVSCLAENNMQTTYKGMVHRNTSSALHIDVLYGPKSRILKNVSIVRGENLVYLCLYTPGNPPTVDFEWTKSGTNVSWVKQNAQNLTIANVQRSDEASYTCKVSSLLQPTLTSATTTQYDTATFYLNILYGAENLQFQINNVSNATVEVDEHSSNQMRCFLESDPGSNIALTKDSKMIIAQPGVHHLSHEIQAECSDAGVYTCSGYNQYGAADNASMQLFVKCSARRPPGVEVQLNFTARQHENASLAYKIVAYPLPKKSQFIWKQCMNRSSCVLLPDDMNKFRINTEGLSSTLTVMDVQIEDYRLYQLSVSNGVGDTLVEWLHLRPIGIPDPPTNFHVIQETIGETTAVMTWKPAFDNGSPQNFSITYGKLLDNTGYVTHTVKHNDRKEINYTVENLEPGTEYFVSLFAANGEGSTAWENVTFITLKRILPEPPGGPPAAVIGGAVGGGIVSILIIAGVVFFVIRLRKSGDLKDKETLTENRRMNRLSKQQDEDDELPDVVENSMYVPAGDIPKRKGNEMKNAATEDLYAQPKKTKTSKPINSDIYAEVKKGKKKGTSKTNPKKQYDNKGFEDQTYENHDIQETKKNVNKDGLIYADLEFANPPKGQKKLFIHGLDDMTVYADVDLTKRAEPLQDSDDDTSSKKEN